MDEESGSLMPFFIDPSLLKLDLSNGMHFIIIILHILHTHLKKRKVKTRGYCCICRCPVNQHYIITTWFILFRYDIKTLDSEFKTHFLNLQFLVYLWERKEMELISQALIRNTTLTSLDFNSMNKLNLWLIINKI